MSYFLNLNIKRSLKQKPKGRLMPNWDEIHDVCIITSDLEGAKKLAGFFEKAGKKCTLWKADKKQKNSIFEHSLNIIGKEDINIFGVPKGDVIARFCREKTQLIVSHKIIPRGILHYLATLRKETIRMAILQKEQTVEDFPHADLFLNGLDANTQETFKLIEKIFNQKHDKQKV